MARGSCGLRAVLSIVCLVRLLVASADAGDCPPGDGGEQCMLDASANRGADPDAHGPFDCRGGGCKLTGRGCHAECECRHLDAVERRRFAPSSGFRYPGRPSLVITASRDGSHTASTWAFNAVRLLLRQAREACDAYWIRRLSRAKLEERARTGAHVVVKTHEWHGDVAQEEFDRIRELFSHVVVSVRRGYAPDPHWMRVATHVVNFEDVVDYDVAAGRIGALRVLRALAEHLGVGRLSDDELRMVDYHLMTLPVPASGCNQTSKLWDFHCRRGGRPPPTPPEGVDQ